MAINHHHHHENGHDNHVKHTEANGHGQEKVQSPTFVGRVTSIPIVVDSMSTVQAYANKSSLGRLAISKANATLTSVSSYQPRQVQSYYQAYVEPHLRRADSLGCRSLDLIEKKFPVVYQPTSEIVSAITAPPQKIIRGARGKLEATVVTPAQSAVRQANSRLASVVDGLEGAVDRYLPSKSPSEKTRSTDTNQAVRVYHVLNEASARIGGLLQEQLSQVPRSREGIVTLASSSKLGQSIASTLQFVNQSLRHSITVYAEAVKNRLPASVTDRLLALHGKITGQLNQVYNFVMARTELPDWVKSRVKTVVDAANVQFESAKKEYQRSDINAYTKAKNVAQGLQTQLLPVLETAQSQLQQYTKNVRQRAQDDLHLPFSFLGLNGVAKTQ